MKQVWIAIMAFCMGGWFGFLTTGIARYDSKGYDLWTIVLLASTIASIGIGVFAFRQAAKIGKKEDEIHALKNGDIANLLPPTKKKR